MKSMKAMNCGGLIAGSALSVLLAITGASAQNAAKEKLYPVHGKVITARIEGEAVGSAGIVGTVKRWVYQVDCGDLYYDLRGKGKPSLTVGQDIDFRIEKENAYLKGEKKEIKYRVVGMGKPDQKQKPD
ncbi:MAG TPA: hypothetical protein VN176_10435 [Verrucomicrobiae bacterium]|jgi:hypothetical protein|nr:hypothetical protein [Verrucomicrobiae bacterium]